ncbi:MAG: peptidase M17 [Cyanobacteria bacterium SZAS-4]|nr:peptidase M17 [Cyanobacteria bacterium SZAS-4]
MFKLLVQLGVLGLTAATAMASETKIIQDGPFSAGNGLSITVRAEGPATRETPLQAVCFFEHKEGGDLLSGGTETFNEKMGGLIKHLRDNGQFKGNELETLLITPLTGTVPAKKILLIGLGDPKTFTAERMQKVGRVAVREALKAGVEKFSFSPNVTDAGVKSIPVREFDQKVIEGVLEGFNTQLQLNRQRLVPNVVLHEFTLEAGAANVSGASEAVKSAIALQKSQ